MVYYLLEVSQVRPDHYFNQTTPKWWTQELEDEFAQIAMAHYPNEACAFVVDGKLVPVENISSNPTEEFELSTKDSILVSKASLFIHSHPDGPPYPSASDMASQKAAAIPYGIITCTVDSASKPLWIHDKNLIIDIEGRPFVHGIFDCYSLIRAYYKQSKNIVIPDYPRDYNWWEATVEKDGSVTSPLNLYLDNFENAGFSQLTNEETLEPGDVILMNVGGNVVNHAAVYIGDGLILHHLRDRIARKDHAASWKKFYHTIVRYRG